ANALSGVTKITLDNGGTYKLTIAGSGENNAATGDIDIRSSVDMFGPSDGVSVATITANPGFGDRIFDIPAGTPSVSASFEPRILISGGQAPSTEDGGGIRSLNAGALFLNQMSVSGNSARNGGGVYVTGVAGDVLNTNIPV